VTTIAEDLGRQGKSRQMNALILQDIYDPLTGKGYNPLVTETPWKGCLDSVKLKNEHGEIS
jgi:hypothetical protein